MQHEEGVLTKVTQARQNAINANGINEKITAENELSGALNGLKIQVEAYPELKANQNFIQLQNEISDVENKLAASRRFFNSSTKELNTSVQKFPNNLLSGMFGFSMQPLFEISSTERATVSKAPKIEF
jgi:LemA protein